MTHARFARRAAVRQARRLATKGLIRRTLLTERLEERSLMAADLMNPFKSDYWNINNPKDVNDDGVVAPVDAILVINALNASRGGQLPQGAAGEAQAATPTVFLDVNNDGALGPVDAILVINALNAEGEGPNGEIVGYTIRAIKPGSSGDNPGDVLTTIEVGQEFDLQVQVQDLRAAVGNRGLFSAYLDILYDKSRASVRVAEIQTLLLDRGGHGQNGNFTLTVDGETTGAISNTGNDATIATRIKDAIGALPSIGGADKIDVQIIGNPGSASALTMDFEVRFIGSHNVDHAPIVGNMGGIGPNATLTVTEDVKGAIPGTSQSGKNSFIEAFRSRELPPDVFEGIYQAALFAQDGDPGDPGDPNATPPRPARPANPNMINDAGALLNGTEPVGTDVFELVRTRMIANAAGTLTFTGSVENTELDVHDTVVFSNDGEPIQGVVPKNLIQIINPAPLIITGITTPNDPPVNTVPGARTINEDQPLTFSAANGNAISISDPDAGAANLRVTLGITNGTLSLSGISGLTFTTGDGTGDANMVFEGSIASINAALAGMTFTPTAEFPAAATGTAVLTITTNDLGNQGVGGEKTDTDSVTITVTGVNDAPVVAVPNGPLSVASISTLPFTGANSISITDVDSGTGAIRTTIAVTGSGNPGTLTLGSITGLTFTTGDGTGDATMTFTGNQADTDAAIKTLVFTPADIVPVTLTVTTNDQGNSGTGGPLTSSDNVTIDVIPPDLPFARTVTAGPITEGSTLPLTIDVLDRVLVNTGAVATLISFTQPPTGQGTVALDDGGTPGDGTDDQLVFTPPGGEFSGTVSFSYTANEEPPTASEGPSTGLVTITIAAENDPPTADNDSYQASTEAPLVVTPPGVLDGDTDPENDPLTAVLATGPASGTLSLNANGGFTYTPSGGGTFSFTYRARDTGGLESTPATVTITVSAPPTANPDGPFAATEDTPFTSTSLVANDQDFSIPPTPLTAVLETNVPAAAGTVVINADNTFTYTPAENFNTTRPATGPVTFTYRASAAGRVSAPATVTINVAEVNDNPTAVGDTFQAVKRNGAVGVDQVVSVLGNDSSAPDGGETLSVVSVSPAATTLGGSVRVEGGQILYTSPTVIGTDTFTYTISDGRGGTATATVTVTVVDFVPKDVSGRVFLDEDNDGVIDANEEGLGGVQVQLSGTDFTNTAVLLSTITDASGNYSFLGLRPGSYTVQQIQPLYLLDGLDTENSPLVTRPANTNDRFTMSWDAIDQSGPITGVNFGERGINISSLTNAQGLIQELQASSQPADGFWLATDMSGNARWSFTLSGWENCASVSFDLNSDLSGGILTVTDLSGATYTRTLLVHPGTSGDPPRIRLIGQAANGDRIIRIDCTAAELGLSMLPAAQVAAAAVPQGEGEGAQYAEAADALFSQQAWA